MRLFTAVEFSSETKDAVEAVAAQLKPRFKSANFTLRGNLHLTLVFIGQAQAQDAA
jgi:2'-5' RNA ligase